MTWPSTALRDPDHVRDWQEPPQNRWTFWHIAELLPSHPVAAAQLPSELPPHPSYTARDVLDQAVQRVAVGPDGADPATVGAVLDDTYTDAWAVVQDGALVAHEYTEHGGPDRTHLLMSVTKSVVGCVAGILADQGVLDTGRSVRDYVPALGASGYADATVRQLLDMRSGVAFSEDYQDPDSDVRALDRWIAWASEQDHSVGGLYPFLGTLRQGAPHGGTFRYRSSESDVLGWVCEESTGRRMPELVSSLLWEPLGAETAADLVCDRHGTTIHDGGLAATALDLARFGRMLLEGGSVTAPDGTRRQVVPPGWLREAWTATADVRTAFRESPAEQFMPGGWYRNQFWFRPGAHGDVLVCLGIYGQMVHVNRRTRTVCVKLSTWPRPQEPAMIQDTLRAFDEVGGALAAGGTRSPAHRALDLR